MPHDIIIFGEGGAWLTKNQDSLERHFSSPQFVEEAGWEVAADKSEAPIALIMTPPATHREICERLVINKNIEIIYCEKPFPDIEDVFDAIGEENLQINFRKKIRIVDHYLLKNSKAEFTDFNISIGQNKTWRLAQRYLGQWFFKPLEYNPVTSNSYAKGLRQGSIHAAVYVLIFLYRVFTFFTGWVPVKYIEIDIKEKDTETREWMFDEDKLGGVIYDLGHHALSILLRMFDEKTLKKIIGKDITIKEIEYFNNENNSAIQKIRFILDLERCAVQINLAKSSVNTSKRLALFRKFMTHAKANQEYSLSGGIKSENSEGYEYTEIFNNNGDHAACLIYSEACTISSICNRVTELAQHKISTPASVSKPKDIELINNLTDQFNYRHSFYWQSYYRLVIYQIIILLTPYAFAMKFAKEDNVQSGAGPAIIIIILTLLISGWIYFWGVHKVTAVLSEEHIRMKVVHDRLKELLNKSKVDLSVISINESSISDVMQTQYRFLVRGFCILNPIVIYMMFSDEVDGYVSEIIKFLFR